MSLSNIRKPGGHRCVIGEGRLVQGRVGWGWES